MKMPNAIDENGKPFYESQQAKAEPIRKLSDKEIEAKRRKADRALHAARAGKSVAAKNLVEVKRRLDEAASAAKLNTEDLGEQIDLLEAALKSLKKAHKAKALADHSPEEDFKGTSAWFLKDGRRERKLTRTDLIFLIVNEITVHKSPLEAAGLWLTEITNAITTATKEHRE
jgi:hypothetical protein